jgi:hypothetical protein
MRDWMHAMSWELFIDGVSAVGLCSWQTRLTNVTSGV